MVELWDLYDDNLNKTDKTIQKSDKVPEGYYHLSVEVWIVNSKKELLMLRSNYDYSKLYPGTWRCLTGNIAAGDDVYSCVSKIGKDKIGVDLDLSKMTIYGPTKREEFRYAYYTCFINYDIDINSIKANEDIYMDYEYVDKNELIKKCNNGEIAYYLVYRINNEIIDKF